MRVSVLVVSENNAKNLKVRLNMITQDSDDSYIMTGHQGAQQGKEQKMNYSFYMCHDNKKLFLNIPVKDSETYCVTEHPVWQNLVVTVSQAA